MSTPYYTDADQHRVTRVLPDLMRHRQLLTDLVWKDVRVRYRYAAMGFFWAVLEPLIMMLVLTFVFSLVFRQRIEGLGIEGGRGYAAFVLCGLIPWQFLSTSLTTATRSLVDNRELVKKVYFTREVIPLSSIGVALVNFVVGVVLLVVLASLLTWRLPGAGIFYFPLIFTIQLALTAGLALTFAAVNAFFRDVAYMVEAAVLFGFYATPVIYPPAFVGEIIPSFAGMYYANPMVGILTAYRTALFENELVPWGMLAWPMVVAAAALIGGVMVFRRHAPVLADQL